MVNVHWSAVGLSLDTIVLRCKLWSRAAGFGLSGVWLRVCGFQWLDSKVGVDDNDIVDFQYKVRECEVKWIPSRSAL